jgi:hypothetical protein
MFAIKLRTFVDGEGVQGLYFAGYTPKALQRYSEKLVLQLDAEVLAQKRIVSEFGRNFRPDNELSYTKVQALINAMVNSRTEEKAFADLEAMGKSAVPAMIMLMDDRRGLPIRHIELRNPSATFEAFRQYGPQVVVDAVTAILNQITGEAFGQTENGGSERERKAAIDGWRVYLYKTRFHAGASTS